MWKSNTVRLEGSNYQALPQTQATYPSWTLKLAGFSEAAYYQLLHHFSSLYPTTITPAHVWGYGRPRWDPTARVYGSKPLRIILLGPAAVGKSTIGVRMCEEFGIPHVNAGELLYVFNDGVDS